MARNHYQEMAETLSAFLGVEVEPHPYDIGYWCRIAKHKDWQRCPYVTHGLGQSAQRGWDKAESEIRAN